MTLTGLVRAVAPRMSGMLDQARAGHDGTVVALRAPRVSFEALAFGPLDAAGVSLRVAPPLHGLGLLAAVPEAALDALAARPAAPGAP